MQGQTLVSPQESVLSFNLYDIDIDPWHNLYISLLIKWPSIIYIVGIAGILPLFWPILYGLACGLS